MLHHIHTVNRYVAPNGRVLNIHAPLRVRTCGHYTVGESFRDNPIRKDFLQLYWGIRGVARIGHQGKTYFLKPQTVFFFLPGDLHDITTSSAPLEYRWFTLDGDNLPNLIQQFELTQKIYPTDSCPVNLFNQLEQHMQEYTLRGEYMASAIAYQILAQAMAGQTVSTGLFDSFRQLVINHYSNPLLSIESMAKALHVHRTTLNRCLETVSGMSPYEYLTAFRLNEALNLLINTGCSIKEITLATGFSDPNYFAKVIRKRYGMSPTELRSRGNLDRIAGTMGTDWNSENG